MGKTMKEVATGRRKEWCDITLGLPLATYYWDKAARGAGLYQLSPAFAEDVAPCARWLSMFKF